MSNFWFTFRTFLNQRAGLYPIRIVAAAFFLLSLPIYSSSSAVNGQSVCEPGEFAVLNPQSSDHIHTSEHFVVRWDSEDNVQLSNYEIQFEADNLASGVYFYRLETSRFTQSKKLTLIR